MFRSRRVEAPSVETAKVAEVVQAYYDAGKRPASHVSPLSEPIAAEGASSAGAETAPFVASEPEFISEPEPAPVAVLQSAPVDPPREPLPVHKTLAELAEELEAFIEVIRYGD